MRLINLKRGQVAIGAVIFTILISLAIVNGIVAPLAREISLVRELPRSRISYYTAESAIEDIAYRISNNLNYDSDYTLSLNGADSAVTVTDNGANKIINVVGDYLERFRLLETKLYLSTAEARFYYGIHVGDGGLQMANNSTVNGSVFSNGSVVGSNGAKVTGDVIVAGGLDSSPAVEWITENTNQTFASTSVARDVAQSFVANETGKLNKLSLMLAKVGAPTNSLTVRLMSDSSNKPSNTTLASGTIIPAQVGTTASWIDLAFSSPPNLTNGTRYWIVLDHPSNQSATNYWIWRGDIAAGYGSGSAKITSTCCSGNPIWANLAPDLTFKVWIGGVSNGISNLVIGSSTAGTARANTFDTVTVHGSSCPNQYCLVENPAREELPISAGVIQDWKDEVTAAEICAPPLCDEFGNLHITENMALGPIKIPGNLSFDNNKTLSLSGTIWVVGDVNFANGCIVELDPDYGSNSGIILASGTMEVANNCSFAGSGATGSYIMLMSDKDDPENQVLDVANNSMGVIYYATNGILHFNNNASAREATAYGMVLDPGAVITYESGLANLNFTSGPGASFQILNWKEK